MEKLSDDEIRKLMKEHRTGGCLSCIRKLLCEIIIELSYVCAECHSRYRKVCFGPVVVGKRTNLQWVRT